PKSSTRSPDPLPSHQKSNTPTHLLSSLSQKIKIERTDGNPNRLAAAPTTTTGAAAPTATTAAPQPRGTHRHWISSARACFLSVRRCRTVEAPSPSQELCRRRRKLRHRPRKLCRRCRKLPRRRVEALWPSPSPLFKRALSLSVFAGVAVSFVVAVTPLPPRCREA
ncbi:hypothetical protein S245_042456, partial [Arachis hypogaea]